LEKSIVKQGYDEAQNSLKERQVEEVKKIVLKTLEKIESLKGEKDRAQEKVKDIDERIKILRMDVDDLKEGRLDRIEERQAKDPEAKNTSVVIIIKETKVEREYPFWNWPYRFEWVVPYWNATQTSSVAYNNSGDIWYTPIDCSSAKWGAVGAYTLTSGNTVNLR
jgi:hypothetical protein